MYAIPFIQEYFWQLLELLFILVVIGNWQLAISLILLILFYYKSKYEESLFIEKYNEYENYKKGTRRFF